MIIGCGSGPSSGIVSNGGVCLNCWRRQFLIRDKKEREKFMLMKICVLQAFQAAWAAACKIEASTILVPSKYEFLVGPISFSGPYCQHNIVFQVKNNGIIILFLLNW